MKIGIGSDHNALELKDIIIDYVKKLGHEVTEYNGVCSTNGDIDYPEVAFELGEAIMLNKLDRGILLCGTGLGMAIAACKVPGIRAVTCHDTYSAERAQLSNNAQVITLGAKIIGPEVAKHIIQTYLSNTFNGGSSKRKVQQIIMKEKEYLQQTREL